MAAHQLGVWQFLPLGPTGYGDSPYQPLSVFAGNPLLINLDDLVSWELLEPDEIAGPGHPDTGRIDYNLVAQAKAPPLELAAGRLMNTADTGLRYELEDFCAANGQAWLDNFAAFSVLKSTNGERSWLEWSAADRAHSRALVDSLRAESPEWHRIRCIQFLFFRQWQALREAAHERDILLFGDIPIYTALDCAESWSRPDLLDFDDRLVPREVAGVPPDYFSADGQLWGNPVYRWPAHAEEGYGWWIERIRHTLGMADIVRLDHFRGFEAFWSVPYGAATARDGRWNPGPGHALFDALAAELGPVALVAEDLGIITESVTELRKSYALPGMQVLQFLIDNFDFDPGSIEQDCVCYTGTHDNDTSEGWFAGSVGHVTGSALESMQQAVLKNLEGRSSMVHKAMISMCFNTRARLAIAPMQDYLGLGSESRLNTPGKAEGNWQWRLMPADLDREDLDFINILATEHNRT
jgi:4-alpha-glucanotransferase